MFEVLCLRFEEPENPGQLISAAAHDIGKTKHGGGNTAVAEQEPEPETAEPPEVGKRSFRDRRLAL